jgi:hypothetical protein
VTAVTVDRLVVRVTGIGSEEARRLERVLAAAFAGGKPAAPAPADELARRIVAGIAAELRRVA